jgi:hypothetical protein
MLRKDSLNKLLNILSSHALTIHSFTVTNDGSSDSLVKVIYKLNPNFFFNVSLSHNQQMVVTRCPGPELVLSTASTTDGIEAVSRYLMSWLNAIVVEDEIPDNLDSDISKLKELFFRELGERVTSEDNFFTQEEASELIKRLDSLEAKLAALIADNAEKEGQVKKLKEKLRNAKSDIPKMTKRKWIFVGGGKVLDAILAIAKSREARKAIISGIAGYLKSDHQ